MQGLFVARKLHTRRYRRVPMFAQVKPRHKKTQQDRTTRIRIKIKHIEQIKKEETNVIKTCLRKVCKKSKTPNTRKYVKDWSTNPS